jgi:hypothetical protein
MTFRALARLLPAAALLGALLSAGGCGAYRVMSGDSSAGDGGGDGGQADAGGDDGGAPDGSHVGQCGCGGGCAGTERCLENQGGGLTPNGVVCDAKVGLAECRERCGSGAKKCPVARPYCRSLSFSAGCCSDAFGQDDVCCANADAKDVTDCR